MTLVEQNYNVNATEDKIFYFDSKDQTYLPLTKLEYEKKTFLTVK
jgi:hypothetical protein